MPLIMCKSKQQVEDLINKTEKVTYTKYITCGNKIKRNKEDTNMTTPTPGSEDSTTKLPALPRVPITLYTGDAAKFVLKSAKEAMSGIPIGSSHFQGAGIILPKVTSSNVPKQEVTSDTKEKKKEQTSSNILSFGKHKPFTDWKPSEKTPFFFLSKTVPFTGYPFATMEFKKLACHQGRNPNESRSKLRKQKKDEGLLQVSYSRNKTSTKKIGCPAKINITKVITTLDKKFQIAKNGQHQKAASCQMLRNALRRKDDITWEERYYVHMPNVEDHVGHPTMKEAQPVVRKTIIHATVDNLATTAAVAAVARVTGNVPLTEQNEDLSRRRKTKRRINDSRRKCIEHNETILKLLKLVQDEELIKHIEASLKTLKNNIEAHVPLETESVVQTFQNKKRKSESEDSFQQKELMNAINILTGMPLGPSD